MEIPYDRLDTETLRAVVEDFVTREGTDYGDRVYLLTEKVGQVIAQLKRGEAVIVWDPASESLTLEPR